MTIGAGYHVLELDLGIIGDEDWADAASRDLVLEAERRLEIEAALDEIDRSG